MRYRIMCYDQNGMLHHYRYEGNTFTLDEALAEVERLNGSDPMESYGLTGQWFIEKEKD